MAMMRLIYTLRHRDEKWFVYLVEAIRACGYFPVLEDVNPLLNNAGRTIFLILTTNRSLCAFGFYPYNMFPCVFYA